MEYTHIQPSQRKSKWASNKAGPNPHYFKWTIWTGQLELGPRFESEKKDIGGLQLRESQIPWFLLFFEGGGRGGKPHGKISICSHIHTKRDSIPFYPPQFFCPLKRSIIPTRYKLLSSFNQHHPHPHFFYFMYISQPLFPPPPSLPVLPTDFGI